MTEQQEKQDWLDKIIAYFKNPDKDIAYSIRKRGEDEIEIQASIFDGYARGLIRFILFSGFLIIGFGGGNTLTDPFGSQIRDFQRDFIRAFNPDERIIPNYKDYLELYNNKNSWTSKEPFKTYEEYRKPYLDKWENENTKFKFILYCIWLCVFFSLLLFAFFLPRPRGLRVNRKKRVIYWQTILGSHSIAFVPEKGDPLGGINYSRFGLYAFGEHERFSLQLWINDYFTKRRATALFGVYPSPSSEHNAQILRAIRAYLTEDDPEFLNYVGRDYKNFGLKFNIALCNAFALRVPFSRKKADAAIEKALAVWHKKTPNQKQGWFNDVRGYQKIINERHKQEELDNSI